VGSVMAAGFGGVVDCWVWAKSVAAEQVRRTRVRSVRVRRAGIDIMASVSRIRSGFRLLGLICANLGYDMLKFFAAIYNNVAIYDADLMRNL
jgi:hypothetical protein